RAAPFGQHDGPERVAPVQPPRFENSRRGNRPVAPVQDNDERGSGRNDERAGGRNDERAGGRAGSPGAAPPSANPERDAPRIEMRRRGSVPLPPPESGERRGVQAPSPREGERRPPVQFREAPPPPVGSPSRRGDEAAPASRSDVIRVPRRQESSPPVAAPPPRDNGRRDAGRESSRETGRDSGSGHSAERDEARNLPGNPANRMAPKRRGPGDEEEDKGRGRRN
ncbi:MAG TPA: hypothetical protein VFH22_12405, partial [Rhodocyclaceae bacterium]|nr:hypothetical protein [Rhodocyclaceae bacterium]